MDSQATDVTQGGHNLATDAGSKRKAVDAGVSTDITSQPKKVHRTRAQVRDEAILEDETESSAVSELGSIPNNEALITPPSSLPELCRPCGQPPISADVRAALCDTISYWKAHQGGIQSRGMVATGMLLNGKTTPRDILQSQVIVTTVGGGLKAGADGKHIRTSDQSPTDRNYVALKNAMDKSEPIGVVIGKKAVDKGKWLKFKLAALSVSLLITCLGVYVNNLLQVSLIHHFNVLDWFFITDIWTEYQPIQQDGSRFKHFVVRLQKIDLTSISWWMPLGQERVGEHQVGDYQCPVANCETCNVASKQIFEQGWCCLHESCQNFFFFRDPEVDTDKLNYNQHFLNERREWSWESPLEPLLPIFQPMQPNELGSEPRFKGGIVCPNCKFASRRISWDGWQCEKGCGYRLAMAPKDVPMSVIRQENVALAARKEKFFEVDSRILKYSAEVTGYEVTTFFLPNSPQDSEAAEWIGSITVFHPTQPTLERKGGLDDLFQDIQTATRQGDVKLRRHGAFCRGSHMEELTSHFSCNMGADYKFGVVVETSNGFDTAPAPVMEALSRLTWGGSTAVDLTAKNVADHGLSVDAESMPNHFVDFNEELLLGYFLKSQISFHDDGEKELGPTVATLSLGSPSTMRFRAKQKAGFNDTIGANNIMLSMVLEHGDMVIMHGTKIHKYYEHAVTPSGIRRYALTCRYIRPEMILDETRRKCALENGTVPSHWQERAYSGETPK
ncbi:hypothetical protein GGR50DRAFT_515609 [Xylaria sp. CBS 124048]|nr:hypothetical protein GGR50DRAFT_515609 [Xylaria sp. CBS 124048]